MGDGPDPAGTARSRIRFPVDLPAGPRGVRLDVVPAVVPDAFLSALAAHLGPEGVAVPGVAPDEPALDQGGQRSAQRLTAHPERARERHETAPALAAQLGKNRDRPAVVEQADES